MSTADTPPQPTSPPRPPREEADPPPRPADPPQQPPPARTGRTGLPPAAKPVLLALLAVAAVVVLVVALTGQDDGLPPRGDRGTGTYTFHAAGDGPVLLDGVSGRVHVTADPGAHDVTARFHRTDGTAAGLHGEVVEDTATGTRALALTCDDDGSRTPCAGDLVLVVPRDAGLRLRQTSGETVLDGLGGTVDVTASSVRLNASGLRSPHVRFAITSGSADLSMAAAPKDFDLTETSASVNVALPHSPDGYAVTTAPSSASTQVNAPRNPASTHHLTLTVTSGSLTVAASAS